MTSGVLQGLRRLLARRGRAATAVHPPASGPIPHAPLPGRVLVTGASGRVATLLRPHLASLPVAWRLTDRVPMAGMDTGRASTGGEAAAIGEEHLRVELTDHASILPLLEGVDAVVHLAGQATHAPEAVHQRLNVQLVAELLRAMELAGVQRLVYASSMHVLGRYPHRSRLFRDSTPRPSGPYGMSKLEAERLVAAAATRFPLRAFVLRMGHVTNHASESEPGNWLAADDLARLVELGLRLDTPGVHLVHAVTPHRGDELGQTDVAARFGMRWRTDAPSYRDALAARRRWYADDPVACRFRGGVYVSRNW